MIVDIVSLAKQHKVYDEADDAVMMATKVAKAIIGLQALPPCLGREYHYSAPACQACVLNRICQFIKLTLQERELQGEDPYKIFGEQRKEAVLGKKLGRARDLLQILFEGVVTHDSVVVKYSASFVTVYASGQHLFRAWLSNKKHLLIDVLPTQVEFYKSFGIRFNSEFDPTKRGLGPKSDVWLRKHTPYVDDFILDDEGLARTLNLKFREIVVARAEEILRGNKKERDNPAA